MGGHGKSLLDLFHVVQVDFCSVVPADRPGDKSSLEKSSEVLRQKPLYDLGTKNSNPKDEWV